MNLNYVSYFSENNSTEKSKDAISQILEKINYFFTKLDVPSLTYIIPIMIIVLFALSFLIGMWLRTKYVLAKVVAVGLTIVGSIAAATTLQNNERFVEYKDAIPFVITLAALGFYWLIRGILFSITITLHILMRWRRKRVDRKRNFFKKSTIRLLTGASNMVASSFGIFLFSNVLLSASTKDNSTSKASQVAVKIMTGGRGASLNGIGNFALSIYQIVTGGDKLFDDYVNNPNNKEIREKFEKVMEGFTDTLNDTNLRNIILKNVEKIPQVKELKLINNETAAEIRAKVASDEPRYALATSEKERKEIATDYIVKNISSIYDQYIQDSLDNKSKSILSNFSTNLNKDAKAAISKKFSEIIEKNVEKQNQVIDFDKVMNSMFGELEKRAKANQPTSNTEKTESEGNGATN
ncbi:hypothetical protein [Mycoplasma sp. OR1901]|uniref:hypothetical protein n=1 Tax=Mycoplasma sp. OR1901 TaxID=2742195 RepID=UPI001583E09D|nr:hypothetical protein [Mycoplasma sp. OR1901]QKT05690.1 hypothetical protein HTZ87_03200 [Mycoplasma sp. OR1901]